MMIQPNHPTNEPATVRIRKTHGGGWLSVDLDGVPANAAFAGDQVLRWEDPAFPSLHGRPLHAAVRYTGERLAGCLGAVFTPVPAGSLLIVVHVREPVWEPGGGVIATGLGAEMAEAAMDGFRAIARSTTLRALGAGYLEVRWAWESAIDSSKHGFRVMAQQLAGVLALPRTATRDDIEAAWQETSNSVTVADERSLEKSRLS